VVGLPACGLGMGLTTYHHEKIRLLCKFILTLGLGWILRINDPSNGI
jgi:hypothetical protein